MKSGASQTFHFNQCLLERQEKYIKSIPILRSLLGSQQMKTKRAAAVAEAGHVKSRG